MKKMSRIKINQPRPDDPSETNVAASQTIKKAVLTIFRLRAFIQTNRTTLIGILEEKRWTTPHNRHKTTRPANKKQTTYKTTTNFHACERETRLTLGQLVPAELFSDELSFVAASDLLWIRALNCDRKTKIKLRLCVF